MADMARDFQVADCWDALVDAGIAEQTVPVTYMNSSAAIKAFTGERGGLVCTSSNAERALRWAFDQHPDGAGKVLFLPDQHLGRNTAVRELGLGLDDCVVYNPLQAQRRADRRAAAPGPGDPVARALLGARPVHRPAGRGGARARAGCPGAGAPRVHLRGGQCRRPGRLHRIHHPNHRGGAGRLGLGDRHRVEPGTPAGRRASGQGDHLPGVHRLLLRHHEPDRPAAPGAHPGVAGARRGRQPDHRSRVGGRPRPAGAGSDVGVARTAGCQHAPAGPSR